MIIFKVSSVLWMAVIFFLSSLTKTDLQDLPKFSDILGHGTLYLILGGLLYLAFDRRRGRWAVFISALYGLTDEFHQHFVPGRTPEIKDLLVDTLAALTAVILIKLMANRQKSH